MTKNVEANNARGVLSRLLRDEAGNVIAIMAAAVVPVLGLVGGGVDMSRLYLAQTRLQAACDAGSLMGRKVMGGGQWTDGSNRANTKAVEAFNANFEPGAFGTGAVTKSFSESAGKVTGTATVVVPMALMQIFGQDERTLNVTCSSEMRIPNSDVMFVLDTTGSMESAADGNSVTTSNPSKVDELKLATKCFYETLTQRNIDDVTASQCGESSDPVETDSNTSQIRFGFVPYSINVNVGRLLPLDYIANTWNYQSREANWVEDVDNSYTLGAIGSYTQVGTPSTVPSSGSWANAANNVTIGSTTYLKTVSQTKNGLDCTKLTVPAAQPTGPTTVGPYQTGSTPTPVYPATSVTLTFEKKVTSGTISYRYTPQYTPASNNKRCYLQTKSSSSVETTSYTAPRPVTWIPKTVFSNWTYKQVAIDVSDLKDTGNNSWNTSLSLPIGASGANTTINWDGCILERQTDKTMSDWDTSEDSTAKDMAIDLVPNPSDPSTLWGPRLHNVLYARTTLDGSGNITSTKTLSNITTTKNMNRPSFNTTTTACPTQSKLYDVWAPNDYKAYVNSITTDGYTFHDIGLLWGARLMSPTGIFATHNAVANDNVQRHMIFMTDGDTVGHPDAMSAYGLPWYDRLQTSGAPSQGDLDAIIDARTEALCTAIKNMNITLWVISYGNGVNSTTEARLEDCASDGKYFPYDPSQSLTAQFKQIAAQISALRLTT
ncbi:MAG: TadE/TadG family type IV pilus assembly protein [Sphingorhabdus sp.]